MLEDVRTGSLIKPLTHVTFSFSFLFFLPHIVSIRILECAFWKIVNFWRNLQFEADFVGGCYGGFQGKDVNLQQI